MRQGKGQPIREDGPQTHLAKRGTPTMGGLMILTSLIVSMLLWMDLAQPLSSGPACSSRSASALIGFLDDYDKVTKRSHKGVSGRVRLLAEFVVAGIGCWIIARADGHRALHALLQRAGDRSRAASTIVFAAFVDRRRSAMR